MIQTIDIYTETEKDFLIKSCELLNISANYKEVDNGVKHLVFTLDINSNQTSVLSKLMEYNYKYNMGVK